MLSVQEQLFHERVRQCIISTLLFATLYILCHIALTRFKKPAEFTTVDEEDATVNKIVPLEPCFSLLQLVPHLPHALCILLH